MFFPFISMFWMKIKEKSRNILTFHGNSFFFSQIWLNYPVSSVSWRINILSKKGHLYFSSEKRNICNFTKKKNFFSPKKLIFWWFSAYFIVFIKNKRKTLNNATLYFFLKKKIINYVFFNVFSSINGILNKTPFYK